MVVVMALACLATMEAHRYAKLMEIMGTMETMTEGDAGSELAARSQAFN